METASLAGMRREERELKIFLLHLPAQHKRAKLSRSDANTLRASFASSEELALISRFGIHRTHRPLNAPPVQLLCQTTISTQP